MPSKQPLGMKCRKLPHLLGQPLWNKQAGSLGAPLEQELSSGALQGPCPRCCLVLHPSYPGSLFGTPLLPAWCGPCVLVLLPAGEEAYKEAGPLLPPDSEEEDIVTDEEEEARK